MESETLVRIGELANARGQRARAALLRGPGTTSERTQQLRSAALPGYPRRGFVPAKTCTRRDSPVATSPCCFRARTGLSTEEQRRMLHRERDRIHDQVSGYAPLCAASTRSSSSRSASAILRHGRNGSAVVSDLIDRVPVLPAGPLPPVSLSPWWATCIRRRGLGVGECPEARRT